MKRSLMKKVALDSRSTIPVKIVLIFISLLVPIYVLLVLSAVSYIHSLEEQATQHAQSILDINLSQLESEIARIDSFFYHLDNNDVNFRKLKRWTGSDEDMMALTQATQTLVTQNAMMDYETSLFFYLEPDDRLVLINQRLMPMEMVHLRENLERSWYIKRNLSWNIGMIDEVPYLYHNVEDSGVFLGTLIDLEDVMERIRTEIPYQNVQVSLTFGPAEEKDLGAMSEVYRTKQYIVVSLDRSEVRETMPVLSRVILAVGLILIIVLPIALILIFMHMIVRPIRKIEEGMFHLGSGEQDYRIPDFKASREFIGMKNSFNNMASEIQTLRIRWYEEALEREQMQLQNLLLQIRPHFLLNFFNQIFSMAELKDYEGIKKSSLYLSKFFRHLFRSERITTLRSELELVDAYLELMEERFTDCFTVEREIDENLLDYRVPPLIVQNFVENIFKYAVSDGNLIEICLSLKQENGYVVMTISDDGPGMEEEILQRIRDSKPIEKDDGTHIGIYNSLYRLKKLCGEDCILDVQSVLTEGTTVRIMLPLHPDGNITDGNSEKKGAEDGEGHNSDR